MGLDMYLKAERYISGWCFDKDPAKKAEAEAKFKRLCEAIGMTPSPESPGIYVKATVGYWRKANAIHNWFVEKVQDGRDECQESDVSREQLKELLEDCRQVIAASKLEPGAVQNGYVANAKTGGKMAPVLEAGQVVVNAQVAEEVLPTRDGFFFGGTNYDQYYIEDVQDTIKILENVLENPEFKDCDFYYRASW